MVSKFSFRRRFTNILVLCNILISAWIILPPEAAHAGTITYPLASSASPNIQTRWFSLRGYGTIRSEVNWPKRTEGCAPVAGVPDKLLPWQAGLPGDPVYNGNIMNGDTMDISTDCSDRLHDGGTATLGGAWVDATAQGAWSSAGVQAANWGPAYPSPSSVVVPKCDTLAGGAAPPIWGDLNGGINPDQTEQFYTSGPVGRYGSTPLPGVAPGLFDQAYVGGLPNGPEKLWGNGVSLIRQNFTLTAADIANLSTFGAQLLVTGVADDFFAVYINGKMTTAITTSAVAVNTLDLTPYIPLLNLTVGATNTLGIMDADKSLFRPVDPLGRQVGACYNLNISYNPPPPPVVDRPGIKTHNGDVHAGGGVGTCTAPPPGTGQVIGNPGANSMSDYAVSGVSTISGFGSNNSNGHNLTLGSTGQYAVICRPDLLQAAQNLYNTSSGFAPLASGTLNLNSLGTGVYIVPTGNVTIDCGGICTVGNRTTLVVLAGDLRINSPIQLTGASHTRSDFPSLGVITFGDIDIAGAVKRVDAYLFSSTGAIDTCIEGTTAACGGPKLTVNGFLMAHHLLFSRTGDSTVNGPTLGEEITLNPIIYLNPPTLFDGSVDNNSLEGQGERAPLF